MCPTFIYRCNFSFFDETTWLILTTAIVYYIGEFGNVILLYHYLDYTFIFYYIVLLVWEI